MPLPAAGDARFREELATVVTAGWRLPGQRHREQDVRYLLTLVPRTHRDYGRRARALLVMLDRAIEGGTQSSGGLPPILSRDQAIGLRILFGLDVEYRETTAQVRRDNAAAYLGESKRGGSEQISGSSLYKRRQQDLMQLALECLRREYAQNESGLPSDRLDIDIVTIVVNFDAQRRVTNTHYQYLVRARYDLSEKLRGRFELPEGARQEVRLETFQADVHALRFWAPHHALVTFVHEKPLAVGERVEFAYRVHYTYDSTSQPSSGHVAFWENNDDFILHVKCRFVEAPQSCWRFGSSQLHYPPAPGPGDHIEPNTEGAAWASFTHSTLRRYVYGIAWSW